MSPAERARPRPVRRRQGGAAAVAVIVAAQLVLLGGSATAVYVGVRAAETRAISAADAVAHAGVVALAADPARLDLEVALQAGGRCLLSDGTEPGVPPGADDGGSPACAAALAEAQRIAHRNGVALTFISIGPDPRAFRDGPVAALFETLVGVRVPGPLAGNPLCRDMQERAGLCWIDEWSAAREAG